MYNISIRSGRGKIHTDYGTCPRFAFVHISKGNCSSHNPKLMCSITDLRFVIRIAILGSFSSSCHFKFVRLLRSSWTPGVFTCLDYWTCAFNRYYTLAWVWISHLLSNSPWMMVLMSPKLRSTDWKPCSASPPCWRCITVVASLGPLVNLFVVLWMQVGFVYKSTTCQHRMRAPIQYWIRPIYPFLVMTGPVSTDWGSIQLIILFKSLSWSICASQYVAT